MGSPREDCELAKYHFPSKNQGLLEKWLVKGLAKKLFKLNLKECHFKRQ
jgi:hypothetical protein